MKRILLTLAMLALPATVSAQPHFDLASGVFRAAITLSDLPWGGTRIDMKIQNTQRRGEPYAIVQYPFDIGGFFVDTASRFDEYGVPGTLHGGAKIVGASNTAVGGVWSAYRGEVEAGGQIGFYDEVWGWSVWVAGCTPIAGVPDFDGIVYGGLYHGYIQTCGPNAYVEFTLDVPHVEGTPNFYANPRYLPAVMAPEPASLMLFATGLVGIPMFARRTRTRGSRVD